MKKFKQIDIIISALLILASLIYGLVEHNDTALIGYFVVGGWQVISMVVHTINRWYTQLGSKRYYYHLTVLITGILASVGFIFYELLFVIMLILLFASPIMAVYYLRICYNEVYVKMQRQLPALK